MDSVTEVAGPRRRRANRRRAAEPRYFNRELSWLAFNRRVLEEACNPRHPLLERVRFLSISASNLDEFFMVRVAGLKAHQALGRRGAVGRRPDRRAAARRDHRRGRPAGHQPARGLGDAPGATLDGAGMHVVGDEPLDDEAEAWLDQHFREQIFPVLTPQAIDPAHPFPFIPNKGLSLIFELKKGKTQRPRADHGAGDACRASSASRATSGATSRSKR